MFHKNINGEGDNTLPGKLNMDYFMSLIYFFLISSPPPLELVPYLPFWLITVNSCKGFA